MLCQARLDSNKEKKRADCSPHSHQTLTPVNFSEYVWQKFLDAQVSQSDVDSQIWQKPLEHR